VDYPRISARPTTGSSFQRSSCTSPSLELFDAAFQLLERLGRGGRLLLSMPIERSDVTPGDERDKLGRLMILRPVAQVKLLFQRLGFTLDHEWTSGDGEGRGILWATLAFRLSEARSRAIDRVESIINADRKVGPASRGARRRPTSWR